MIGGGEGEMRLAVQSEPPWSDAVFRAAALAEVIDSYHRAGNDRQPEEAAFQLEAVLAELRRDSVEAWLTS
jgi:hypothetical protein